MDITIPKIPETLTEALKLADEILTDIELNRIPLTQIAFKTNRLARLLGDNDFQKIMHLETSGYPTTIEGFTAEGWHYAKLSGRVEEKVDKDGKIQEKANRAPIEVLESNLELMKIRLSAAKDPDVSISSASPAQMVFPPPNNKQERDAIIINTIDTTRLLSSRRSLIYDYVSRVYYQLKYSAISDDIFSKTRTRVDSLIREIIPESVKRFDAIYENLKSQNPEDWSNAVHSCRRILKDLADKLSPSRDDKEIEINGVIRTVKLGEDQYINRIIDYIEVKSNSVRYNELVGSQLRYLGDRLDSISKATHKGSHTTITKKEEAERYIIYTYLLIGDILSLK